jgi:glycosyltransferase involved in cell wall biosynthesis
VPRNPLALYHREICMIKPPLICISLYKSVPAYNGGSNRISQLARAYSRHFNVSLYGHSLRHLRRSEIVDLCPGIQEYQGTTVPSFIGSAMTRKLGLPQLLQGTAFTVSPPRWLTRRVQNATAVTLEQPWHAEWTRRSMRKGALLVYDAHNVEVDMFPEDSLRLPRFLRASAIKWIKRQEQRAVLISDLVVVTSEDDGRRMADLYGCNPEKIHVAQNGVDCSRFAPVPPEKRVTAKSSLGFGGKPVAVFLGAKHPPNKIAVDEILKVSQLPECRHIQFVIIGAVASYFPESRFPNVQFTGFLNDTSSYFAAADIAINTVATGGGTSLKQPEYMARGLPTVTTKFGARGFAVEDGHNAIIRESSDIADGILFLARNPSLAEEIGRRARASAAQYDWADIGARLAYRLRDLHKARATLLMAQAQL